MIECLKDKQAIQLSSQLDKQEYDAEDLISIKTPLNLPYYTGNSEQFERAYGSVKINGVDYEYVKRRVYQDTLELLCLPNKEKSRLESAKNEYFRMSVIGQQQGSDKNPNANILKICLTDYFQEFYSFSINGLTEKRHNYFSFNTRFVFSSHTRGTDRPPDSMHSLIS